VSWQAIAALRGDELGEGREFSIALDPFDRFGAGRQFKD
jgi:hypothetical protein